MNANPRELSQPRPSPLDPCPTPGLNVVQHADRIEVFQDCGCIVTIKSGERTVDASGCRMTAEVAEFRRAFNIRDDAMGDPAWAR